MQPHQNPVLESDEALLDRGKKRLEEMQKIVENMMVDFTAYANDSNEEALAINERILQLLTECAEAKAEEQMLREELQRYQEK